MTEPSPQLDYAPAPPTLQSRRARRWAFAIGAVLVLVGVISVTPRAVRRLQLVYAQRQCLAYVAPPDQVVYDNDRAALPQLLAPPSRYRGSLGTGQAFLIPRELETFSGPLTVLSTGTAFLHARAAARGDTRLVVVQLFRVTSPFRTESFLNLIASVYDPGTALRGPRDIGSATRGDGSLVTLSPGDTLRVFAGQPDPNDASHFTIDYELNGARYTLDGWLKGDGLVMIEARE